MAGLLKRQAPHSADTQSILADIIHEAQTANRIVLDVLEFVRPINLQIEQLSVPDVLRDAVAKYEGQVTTGHLSIDTRFDEDFPRVQGDHIQLRQLFTNLLINAFEALKNNGHVTISVAFAHHNQDPLVGEDPREPKGWLTIHVDDDGSGIPTEVAEKIFSPFFTTKPRGTELGLAIVRKIVDAHNGRIDMNPRPQGGTRFEVTLPVTGDGDSLGSGAHPTNGASSPHGS